MNDPIFYISGEAQEYTLGMSQVPVDIGVRVVAATETDVKPALRRQLAALTETPALAKTIAYQARRRQVEERVEALGRSIADAREKCLGGGIPSEEAARAATKRISDAEAELGICRLQLEGVDRELPGLLAAAQVDAKNAARSAMAEVKRTAADDILAISKRLWARCHEDLIALGIAQAKETQAQDHRQISFEVLVEWAGQLDSEGKSQP